MPVCSAVDNKSIEKSVWHSFLIWEINLNIKQWDSFYHRLSHLISLCAFYKTPVCWNQPGYTYILQNFLVIDSSFQNVWQCFLSLPALNLHKYFRMDITFHSHAQSWKYIREEEKKETRTVNVVPHETLEMCLTLKLSLWAFKLTPHSCRPGAHGLWEPGVWVLTTCAWGFLLPLCYSLLHLWEAKEIQNPIGTTALYFLI